jgi:hypothetical protein
MAGVCTCQASISAHFAMLVIVFVAFLCAHPADILTNRQILFYDFRIPLNQSRRLQTNVGAVPGKLNASRQQSYVFFVQTSGFTLLTCKRTIN